MYSCRAVQRGRDHAWGIYSAITVYSCRADCIGARCIVYLTTHTMTIYFPLIHTNTHNLQGQGPVQVRLILSASLFVPASAGRERWLARSTLDSAARRYHSSTWPTSNAKRRSRRSKCSLRLALAAAKCRREPTCFGSWQKAGPHGRMPLPLSGGGQPTHRNERASTRQLIASWPGG